LAKDTIPELLAMLRSKDDTWETRQAAALALGTVAYDQKNLDQKVVDALFGTVANGIGLHDTAVKVRLACLGSLNTLGVGEHDYKGFIKKLDTRITTEPNPIWKLRA